MLMTKNILKIRDQCHYTDEYRDAAHSTCNLGFISKDILIIFHDGSNYNYHVIRKELAKELAGKFSCLRKIKEKYVTFLVPIKSEIETISSRRKEIKPKIISYKLKFIDSTRFMTS